MYELNSEIYFPAIEKSPKKIMFDLQKCELAVPGIWWQHAALSHGDQNSDFRFSELG